MINQTEKAWGCACTISSKTSFVVHNNIVFIGCAWMMKHATLNIHKNALQDSETDVSFDVVLSGQNLIFQDNRYNTKQL